MAEILLFHHAQGPTVGCRSRAERLWATKLTFEPMTDLLGRALETAEVGS